MDVSPAVIAVISIVLSSGKVDPSTSHPKVPVLTLQLKVAVDPSVALTDVGVLVKAEIIMNKNRHDVDNFTATCNMHVH